MSTNDQSGSGSEQPRLRVVNGGVGPTLAGLPVEVRSTEADLEGVEAVAVEDDTYFVLGADPGFKEPTEHPIRVWTEVHETEPALPGSVHVRKGYPLRLHAVIHDLSCDPTWKEEWVAAALNDILRKVGNHGSRSLALPALGMVHGKLPLERFLDLLRAALERSRPAGLDALLLLANQNTAETLLQLFDD